MKVCCETGKEIKTDYDKLACNHDHCKGAKEMTLEIRTPVLQPWQIAGWIDQGYYAVSFVEGCQGYIRSVSPGKITIAGQGGVDIIVDSIPTTEAKLDDPYILIGYNE